MKFEHIDSNTKLSSIILKTLPISGDYMSLIKSARTFLVESLDNYSRQKITFSILHAMISLELLLKERLYRISPDLIYANVDSKKNKKKFTIQLSAISTKLKSLGVNLTIEEIEIIKLLSGWRNDIVHHLPTHEDKTAKIKLELLYNFIINFLVKELKENFQNFLPKKYYERMQTFIDELNQEIMTAKRKAEDSGHADHQNSCPTCSIIGVVEIKDEDGVYCHLCFKKLQTNICSACEKPLHTYSEYLSVTEEYCSECIETAGDLYIDHLIDLERGK